MTLDLDAIEKTAREATQKSALVEKPWRVEPDGRTVWSGDWTKDGQQHPVCTYHVTDGNGRSLEHLPPPIGTTSVMAHIATSHPAAVLEMVAEIRRTAAEVLDHQAKLARLYNAMCGAMAWLAFYSDNRTENEAIDVEHIRSEMHAVFNASPAVLYQAGPGVSEAFERMDELRRLAPK